MGHNIEQQAVALIISENKCHTATSIAMPYSQQRHNNLSHIDNYHRLPTGLLGKGEEQPAIVATAAAAAAATASSLVIQLPTTSGARGDGGDGPVSPRRQTTSTTTTATTTTTTSASNQRAHHLHNKNLKQHLQPSHNCHHQAATRDLMLNSHQNHRHRYFQLSAAAVHVPGASGLTPTTTDLEQQQQRQLLSDNDSDQQSITPPPNYHEIPGIVPSYHGRTSGPPPAYDDVINPHASPPTYQSLFGQVREARKTSNGLVDLLRQLFLVLIGTIGCTMIIGFLLLIPITMILVGFFYINECRAENIPSFLVVGGFVWIIKNMLNCYNQFKKDSQTINRPPPPPAGRRPPVAAAAAAAAAAQSGPTATSSSTSANNHQLQQVVATSASANSSTTTTTTSRPATTTSSNQRQQQQQIRHPQMIGLTSYKCESFLNYFLVVWFLAGCIVVYRIYEPDYDNPLSLSYCNRTVYLYAFWLMTSAFIIMALVLSCLCCLMASSLMSCSHGR